MSKAELIECAHEEHLFALEMLDWQVIDLPDKKRN